MRITYFILIIALFTCHLACEQETRSYNDPEEQEYNTSFSEEKRMDFRERRGRMNEKIASFEASDRKNWQKPEYVIERLRLSPKKVVAEIGAGSGYFSFRILPDVKKVIATDIDTQMISFMESNKELLPAEFRDKLETRLVAADDPGLEKNEVDLVFLVNTYCYIENRVEYFSKVKELLREGGKVVIVDYKMRDIPVGPSQDQKVPLYQVENEMREAGFKRFSSDDRSLPYQYLYVAWPE